MERQEENVFLFTFEEVKKLLRKEIMTKLKAFITRAGTPALCESGGGLTHRGSSQIVCGPKGEKKTPIHIFRGGHLACEDHAIFRMNLGDYVINVHGKYDGDIYIQRIEDYPTVIDKDIYFPVNTLFTRLDGEWVEDKTPFEELYPAIEAALSKARCYHCRSVHYASERNEKNF